MTHMYERLIHSCDITDMIIVDSPYALNVLLGSSVRKDRQVVAAQILKSLQVLVIWLMSSIDSH